VDLVRRMASGRLECDVIAPADHRVIDAMLVPAGLADYSIGFAAGRMVVAYSASDSRAAALQVSGTFAPPASVPRVSGAWHEVLTAPGVRIAGAHPFLDPGGYRSHMMFELAQSSLNLPGLYNALLQHYQVTPADPAPGAAAAVLGREFSFQFTYEHTAAAAAKRDPSYRYALLPESIDLSSANEAQYAGSRMTIPGLGTAGSAPWVTIPASRVAWGVTIATNSRHRDAALSFLSSLLGPPGREALAANGPPPLAPARVARAAARRLPDPLRGLVVPY
jgi:ABC-type molybdate transport system substrate-binding protein